MLDRSSSQVRLCLFACIAVLLSVPHGAAVAQEGPDRLRVPLTIMMPGMEIVPTDACLSVPAKTYDMTVKDFLASPHTGAEMVCARALKAFRDSDGEAIGRMLMDVGMDEEKALRWGPILVKKSPLGRFPADSRMLWQASCGDSSVFGWNAPGPSHLIVRRSGEGKYGLPVGKMPVAGTLLGNGMDAMQNAKVRSVEPPEGALVAEIAVSSGEEDPPLTMEFCVRRVPEVSLLADAALQAEDPAVRFLAEFSRCVRDDSPEKVCARLMPASAKDLEEHVAKWSVDRYRGFQQGLLGTADSGRVALLVMEAAPFEIVFYCSGGNVRKPGNRPKLAYYYIHVDGGTGERKLARVDYFSTVDSLLRSKEFTEDVLWPLLEGDSEKTGAGREEGEE